MRKKRVWGISVGLLLCAALVAPMVLIPSSRITRENFARIEKGMLLADIESILGEKSTYSDRRGVSVLHWWHGNEGNLICVVFDEHQKAHHMNLREDAGPPRSIYERTWNHFFPQYPWRWTGKRPIKGYEYD